MTAAQAGPAGRDGRTLPPPQALLFDLDGTLVDTVGIRVEAWAAAFAEVGVTADPVALGRLMGSDGRSLAREVAARAGRTLSDVEAEALDQRAGELFGQRNVQPRALPGVSGVLDHLDGLGLPWAIATSSRPEQVQASIDALGLDHQPLVADGSHVEHAKPAPDLLLNAAAQMGVRPAGVWYVGDSTWDMQAAVAAGMVPVGVSTGATAVSGLRSAGAVVALASLSALPGYLLRALGRPADAIITR